ncbi:MAG: hypothetical protein LBB26_02090 [Puniceicoccales bacterium]|jgi:hypothetical protein|nr:hypothetical protein [Puniceicoccales bacterium]
MSRAQEVGDVRLATALLNAWSVDASAAVQAIGPATGPPVFFDKDGKRIAEVTKPSAVGTPGTKSVELVEGVADRVVMVAIGTCGAMSVFLIKNDGYLSNVVKFIQEATNGRETMFRYVVADSGFTMTCKIPAAPEGIVRTLLGGAGTGGLATGFTAFCTFLGLLCASLAGFNIPGQGIFLSAVTAILGFLLGSLAQWFVRRYAMGQV